MKIVFWLIVIIGLMISSVFNWLFDPPRHPPSPISHVLTYKELIDYPIDCAKAPEQLTELLTLKATKNFNPDPDQLNESDYEYNSRLNLTIWWYAYSCGDQK